MNFKRLIALLLMLTVICSVTAIAQERVVTGKVTDSKDGTPLSGITIQVKGTKNATQTAADGSFKVRVDGDATLVVTSIGYAKQEVSASTSPITVSLVQNNAALGEVVVVGYSSKILSASAFLMIQRNNTNSQEAGTLDQNRTTKFIYEEVSLFMHITNHFNNEQVKVLH